MRRPAAPVALLYLLTAGCGADVGDPLPQWTVFVGTDASVPQFGDRLLVEVLGEDGDAACLGCRRQLGAGEPAAWPLSFGVVPPGDGGAVRVRARLYRADHTGEGGLPSGLPVIDALARLPPASEPVDVGVALSMTCLAVPADVVARAACDPRTGALAPEPELAPAEGGGPLPRPGTFPSAAEVPCAGAAPPGMICHPGGLFALGDPYFFPVDPDLDPLPERLVQLSPFALDADEVTVGAVRALVASGALAGAPELKGAPGTVAEACTWLGPDDASNDALPVSCASRALAEAACAARGLRLPTEAEWEFAAANRTRETRFPWGDDEHACDHAIVGRGRFVTEVSGAEESVVCRGTAGEAVPWGPVAGGAERDVSDLGVKNLAGNLSEWVADRYGRYDEPCWSDGAAALLVDPRCDAPSPTPELAGAFSVRGASWVGRAFHTRAAERGAAPGGASVSTGFRCALSL